MSDAERWAALMARLDTLERHALNVREAFTRDAFKQDADDVLQLLRSARRSLEGSRTADDLVAVERTIAEAGVLLAALGRTT